MGKAKRKNMKPSQEPEKVGLEEQIMESKMPKQKNRVKIRMKAEEENFVDARMTRKILDVARKQQMESLADDPVDFTAMSGPTPAEAAKIFRKASKAPKLSRPVDSDDEDDDGQIDEQPEVTEHDFFDDIKVSEEDEKALEMFQNKSGPKTKTLSEIIMEKIAEKQGELHTQLSDVGSLKIEEIDPRVREMYEGVRDVMKKYRSGKVPKAFKVIPKLRNWEQILFITEPHHWSAAAMYRGTRIFSSVLSHPMAQRFYNLVLMPRIRDDLCEYKRLNSHLYAALRKALFKPAAFFKGIILPLLESGDCNLREAIIFGSVIARNQIPVLHSSACLLKICEMEYSGANSIFIRILLDKRYALPYRVVDAAVFHFVRFEHDKRTMPVLWHQSFLTFVQRYKNDISSEQKEVLLGVLRKQSHPKLTPEIRRELLAAKCRDVEVPIDQQMDEEAGQEVEYDPVFDTPMDSD
ncbi:bystin [Phlebotomus argentipes]|uniref:bystin n=1 Tax=Phlebotomus argentipes TaxID=94469 RepID=UPI0028932A5F|nr:bystin [Phlebotomus argentipes]